MVYNYTWGVNHPARIRAGNAEQLLWVNRTTMEMKPPKEDTKNLPENKTDRLFECPGKFGEHSWATWSVVSVLFQNFHSDKLSTSSLAYRIS